MRTSKQLNPIDLAVAEILGEKMADSGTSYRALRNKTGLSINRIGIILRKEPPPATVGEATVIALELGMTVDELFSEAARRASTSNERPDFSKMAANQPGHDIETGYID